MQKIYRQSDIHTFCHTSHPYEPFNIKNATTIIVGSTPPARFGLKELQQQFSARYETITTKLLFIAQYRYI